MKLLLSLVFQENMHQAKKLKIVMAGLQRRKSKRI